MPIYLLLYVQPPRPYKNKFDMGLTISGIRKFDNAAVSSISNVFIRYHITYI